MLAWPAHIILDLFTHSIEFFPTPIFWPWGATWAPGPFWGVIGMETGATWATWAIRATRVTGATRANRATYGNRAAGANRATRAITATRDTRATVAT